MNKITGNEDDNEDLGFVTLGGGGELERKAPIKSVLQATYKDNRLVTVLTFEEAYGITIENPSSTGRSSQNMHLTEESLVALISTAMLHFCMQGKDIKELIEKSAKRDEIDFSYSKNMDVSKLY